MKTAIIVMLAIAFWAMSIVALRNSIPLCDELVRQNGVLVCELNLGDIPEDRAEVRIRK